MAELILALGLFAMIAVCLTTLFLALLSSSNKASDISEGDIFAQKRLQILIDTGLTLTAPPIAAPVKGSFQLQTAEKATTSYFYTVTAQMLDSGGAGKVSTYMLTMDVNWSSQDVSGRPLVGETTTRVQRVVHVDPP